jgi:hypothetical protein
LVEKLIFEKGSEKFELIKNQDRWEIASQPQWRLDQNRVRETLMMLNSTELLEYIVDGDAKPEELRKWSFNKPRLQLKAELRDRAPWQATFAVGPDRVHRLQVQSPSYVFKISPTDSDKFSVMNPDYFRDRSEPFLFDRVQVSSVELKVSQGSVSLKADDEKAKVFLNRLGSLRVDEFKFNPAAKLTEEIVLRNEQGEAFKLQWGGLQKQKMAKGESQVYFAKSSQYPQGFTLRSEDLQSLQLEELLPAKETPGSEE